MPEEFRCEMPSWDEAYDLAKKAGEKIMRDGYSPDCIIGIARGGWVPSMMLSDLLGVKELISITAEHWGKTGKKDSRALVKYLPDADLSGKRILLVDDLTDTGESFEAVLEEIRKLKPKEIRTATLIHKTQSKYRPDYFGRESGKWAWIILPWNVTEDLISLIGKIDCEKNRVTLEELQRELKNRFCLKVDKKTLEEALLKKGIIWGK